jgi:hypothetical protein
MTDDPDLLTPAPANGDLEPTAVRGEDPILAMIERAARDPNVDVAKFERLMAMRVDLEKRQASLAFAQAFAAMQTELPVIDRRGRIVIAKEGKAPQDSRYAAYEDILEAIRPILFKHDFSLRFEHETTADGRLATTAILRHAQGHEERATTPPLQHDSTGSKNAVQAVGSSLSYGRRYALLAVLPIVSHAPADADDDGAKAGGKIIGIDEIALLEQLIRDTESDKEAFLAAMGAASIAEMTFAQFDRGKKLLNEKKRRANAQHRSATNR